MKPNEASGLLLVRDEAGLAALGWDIGLWTMLDEGRAEDCLALIGRRQRAPDPLTGWEIRPVSCQPVGRAHRTADTESVARHAGFVYLFGSHFGTPRDGLCADRHYVARFRESDLAEVAHGRPLSLQIVRDKFRLHRAVNDALAASALELWPVSPRVRRRFIRRTRKRGQAAGKQWAARIHKEDWPINIEGATFRNNGDVLIGLRFPCTAAGQPILVGIRSIQRWFDEPAAPVQTAGVWVLENIGRRKAPAGVRDMDLLGDELHLLTGNLDAELLVGHRRTRAPSCAHWRALLPDDSVGGAIAATRVRSFKGLKRIEGLAIGSDGQAYYVSDEDSRVMTRFEVSDATAPTSRRSQ